MGKDVVSVINVKPVVVNPLIVSKYAFVKRSNGLVLLNTLFHIKGILSNNGRIVKAVNMSQRDVFSSSSFRSQKELNMKPAPKDRKQVAPMLKAAWVSPF